jgi:hypothetical protein
MTTETIKESDEKTGNSTLLFDQAEKALKEKFSGYHLELMLYPSGGMIQATGCEECGTDDSKLEVASWKTRRGGGLGEAAERLAAKLKK